MTDLEKLPNIVSYWKLEDEFILYNDEYFFVIYGEYDHKNSGENVGFGLGICWKDYPMSHGKLCPTVLDEKTSKIILLGLSSLALMENDTNLLTKINKISSKIFTDKL